MNVIVFDIWGDYAHFRKNISTSSPLTHSFPPRTALAGMIGAIAGIEKDEYQRFTLDVADIGCRILRPIKKTRISGNWINTDNIRTMNQIRERLPTRREYLKDPKFRVYFSHRDKYLIKKMRDLLYEHQSIYTPCMGLSEMISNFSYIGEFELKRMPETEIVMVDSVIPLSCLLDKVLEERNEYFTETIPMEMGADREVTGIGEVLFERNAKGIRAKAKNLWEICNGEHEHITFLTARSRKTRIDAAEITSG
jgi:CRISPR-associated protein Cas5h